MTARKYVEMYNKTRKKHLEAALRKAAEWKRQNTNYKSRRTIVREKDTLIQMIEDRKSRESRRGATETEKLQAFLEEDDINNDPIILETTLEEM